ncbi:hypothetical protein KR222_004157 [Zaprionus bogoriensis]|nr:hypothetical protein KR222_004157 [Zaprionus bogoriensis]
MAEETVTKTTKKSEGSRSKSTAQKTQTQDKKQKPAATAQLQPEADMEEEQASQPAAYSMRPAFGESFPLPLVKSIINSVMAEKLKDKVYDKDVAKVWTREIADEVNQQIASSPKVKRYKHVVQVMLGQELGAGATYLSRCCWDCDCDTSVTEVFSNTSLFCVCTVYGTYQY